MSTRKSTTASTTAQGTKAENATAGTGTTTVTETASSLTTPAKISETKQDITTVAVTPAPSAGNTTTSITTSTLEKSETAQSDIKPFQQRVTRNSPLLLAPIKKEPLDPNEATNSESEEAATGKRQNAIRGRKSIKDHKETKEQPQEKEKEDKEAKKEDKKEDKDTKKDDKTEVKEANKDDKKEDLSTKENVDTPKEKELTNKDSSDSKVLKETKEQKDLTGNITATTSASTSSASSITTTTSPTSSATTTTTNRLTRKSTASQENLSSTSTRVTRQRHTGSGGVSTRSETPPARGRGRPAGRVKMPLPIIETVAKRKRSVDNDITASGARKTSTDEPGPKFIKIEVKDPELDGDDLMQASQNTNTSTESTDELANIKIKQEIMDDCEMETTASSTVPTTESAGTTAAETSSVTTTNAATAVRGKGRWPSRKSNSATNLSTSSNNSPSTRATRQTKQNSPVRTTANTAAEPKRRRMGSQTRSLLKTNQGTVSKTQPINPEDEDSKDSTASSTNTDDIVLAHIKIEKPTMYSEEFLVEDTKIETEPNDDKSKEDVSDKEIQQPPKESIANDLPPLTVDIETAPIVNTKEDLVANNVTVSCLTPPTAASKSPSLASGSEKAASLSPSELVSEGVSEISVKQFYKKPKFLENNLGIEEDPKLGNIVQKVVGREPAVATTTTLTASTSALTDVTSSLKDKSLLDDSPSNESMKEGTLRLDESLDDKKTLTPDDSNSLSSDDKLGPLVVDEDDEMEEINEILKSKAANEQAAILQTEDALLQLDEKVELKVSESDSNAEETSATAEVSTANLEAIVSTIIKDDEELEEDDLTAEESETISMDNNASVNNDVTNEIEDAEIEEDLTLATDIDDITTILPAETIENKIDLELSAPLQFTEDSQSQSSDDNLLVIDDKENQDIASNTSDDDRDVLAKIDAELKKIDERHKEKLLAASKAVEAEKTEIVANVITDTTEQTKLEEPAKLELCETPAKSIDVTITTTTPLNIVAMDADEVINDIKIPVIEVEKTLTKDEPITDLDLKLVEEESPLLLDDTKISDSKKDEEECAAEKTEDVEIKEAKTEMVSEEASSEAILPDNGPYTSKESPSFTDVNIHKKDDDTTSMKSGQSTNSWITLDYDVDDEESSKRKELHLQNLGLVTHKAAEIRRLEVIQNSVAAVEANKVATQLHQTNKRNGKNSSHAASTTHHEYTGTLKTIIKLNRNSTGGSASGGNGRKSNAGGASSSGRDKEQQQRRQSLKMTFQKGRGRAHGAGAHSDRSQHDREGHEDSYYTIQNETEGAQHRLHTKSNSTTSTTSSTRLALNHINNTSNTTNNSCNSYFTSSTTYARKSYNYRNSNHQQHYNSSIASASAHNSKLDSSHSESHDQQSTTSGILAKKDEKILIPEKASSFKFHPGRLCEDQCYYCSGKFGLYDTPCHVGQIKSMERQQKILANEEKLTVDNCLCDACFRHVDRRANVPSYKKRLSAPGGLESAANSLKANDNQNEEDHADGGDNATDHYAANASHHCLVTGCSHPAAHSLRRKCIRKSVKKFLLKFDVPTSAACIWLCQSHYDTVIQCSGCVLCKRRLGKNHMYHITSDTDRLEKALSEMGIPVQLGIGTAVCKLCRYFANLLMKPPDSTKSQKAEFVKNYRKRLLQFHNIHDGSNDASEADEDDSNGPSYNNDISELQRQQEKTPQKQLMPEDQDSSSNQKDTNSPQDSVNSIENDLNEQARKTTTTVASSLLENASETLDRDFENAAGISTDSSNSSASNTASHSPSEMSKLKAILQSNSSSSSEKAGPSAGNSTDISNVLRANPNISMRELFPGEEDLGLHFKVPFGSNASQRTPEGWTRVQTFLQYDEPTRRLWEDLQKPYGNQSSFLRHLILLEKYFRNGELVLSASASNNASVYTQTVRQRLTSFDKGHCGGLHIGTGGLPKEANKTKTPEPQIPTYEIQEDDDDEDEDDDDDVEITAVQKISKTNSSQDLGSHHNQDKMPRSRSLSVDKLTKQLSTNAVTITARPKDAAGNKRSSPSPQKSLLKDTLAGGSNQASSTANLAAANAAAAVALAASSANSNACAASNSRSILKCNLLGINKSVEIVPINNSPANTSHGNRAVSITNAVAQTPPPAPPPPPTPPAPVESKQQKILDVANRLLGNQLDAASGSKNAVSLLSSPPELVSLQRRTAAAAAQAVSATAVTNTQTSSSSTTTNATNANLTAAAAATNSGHKRAQLSKPGTSRPPPNVVILPDTLTPQERLQSKTWRPTLMPVEENLNLLKNGPLYQTADGRRLPALVQVQSGGKPFLISIFDYNRMCILRREKLMRDQMLKATKKRQEAKQQSQQQQQQQHLQQQQQQQQQQLQQQHMQQQQQNLQKNLQNMSKNFANASVAAAAVALNQQRQHQQQQQAQQQQQHQQQQAQQQLIQLQMIHQQALMKAAANNASNAQQTSRFQPKPSPATSNISNMPPLQTSINSTVNFPAPMMPLLANAITNAANTGSVNSATNPINNHTSWLWNNFPDANQLLLNGGAVSGGGGGPVGNSGVSGPPAHMIPKLPQLLTKTNHPNNPANLTAATQQAMKQQQHHQQQQQHHHQQQQQQQQLLLSKIPKSLTVIPQHKLMNSAAAASGHVGGGNAMKE